MGEDSAARKEDSGRELKYSSANGKSERIYQSKGRDGYSFSRNRRPAAFQDVHADSASVSAGRLAALPRNCQAIDTVPAVRHVRLGLCGAGQPVSPGMFLVTNVLHQFLARFAKGTPRASFTGEERYAGNRKCRGSPLRSRNRVRRPNSISTRQRGAVKISRLNVFSPRGKANSV